MTSDGFSISEGDKPSKTEAGEDGARNTSTLIAVSVVGCAEEDNVAAMLMIMPPRILWIILEDMTGNIEDECFGTPFIDQFGNQFPLKFEVVPHMN